MDGFKTKKNSQEFESSSNQVRNFTQASPNQDVSSQKFRSESGSTSRRSSINSIDNGMLFEEDESMVSKPSTVKNQESTILDIPGRYQSSQIEPSPSPSPFRVKWNLDSDSDDELAGLANLNRRVYQAIVSLNGDSDEP